MVVFHMQKMHNLDKKIYFFILKEKEEGVKRRGGGREKNDVCNTSCSFTFYKNIYIQHFQELCINSEIIL